MNYIIKYKKNIEKNTINLPTSKSILLRMLFILAISDNTVYIKNIDMCYDVYSMIFSLKNLGKKIILKKSCIKILKGFNKTKKKIFLYNSGLASRIIFMFLFFKNKNYIKLCGEKNLNKRPIYGVHNIYESFLNNYKNHVFYYKKHGFLPLRIYKKKKIELNERISSQYLSAFILNASIFKSKIIINLKNIISSEYVKMTISLMKKFGLKIKYNKKNICIKKLNKLKLKNNLFFVEKDCSSASYFFMFNFIKRNIIRFNKNLLSNIQTEIKFINVLKKIGLYIKKNNEGIITFYRKKKINSISIDCKNVIDTSMSFCLLLEKIKKIKLYNIYNWDKKESKRIKAISKECKVIGFNIKKSFNWIIIKRRKYRNNILIKNYNDHRICMTYYLFTKKKIFINKPNSVKKTFPNFFRELNV
ncbi:hypothetical protein ACWNX6_00600 [Candidatus Vidania fulgoroideorum]